MLRLARSGGREAPGPRWTYALAFLIAASAVGALLLYYSVDFGRLGPLPRMYDPSWYGKKTISLVGEGVATPAALAGFFTVRSSGRRSAHSRTA